MKRNSAPCQRSDFFVSSRARSNRGFTLIEIMVVVLIIGVMAAGIVISVGITGRDSALEKESNRALQLIQYAREKAGLQTREFGLYFGDHAYQFLTFDPRRNIWRPVDEDDALRQRNLPSGLRLHLEVEGRQIVLKDTAANDTKKTKEQLDREARDRLPHLMIFSNGDLTSFKLTVEREDPARSVTIVSKEDGTIEAGKLIEGRT